MSHTHIHIHTRDGGPGSGPQTRTHGEQGPDIKAGSNTRQPSKKPDPEPFRGYDTKECDCGTYDYGTSEGARKRGQGSTARPNAPMSPRKAKMETERKAYISSLPKPKPQVRPHKPDPFLRRG